MVVGAAAAGAQPAATEAATGAGAGAGADRVTVAVAAGGPGQGRIDWRALADRAPDLVLTLGDLISPPSAGGRDDPVAAVAQAYDRLGRTRDFRRLVAQVPMLAMWGGREYGAADLGRALPFRAEAKRLFLDFHAHLPDDTLRARPGLFYAATLGAPGRRVQILMLDTQWFRDPWAVAADGRVAADPGAERRLLGDLQWAWLDRRLAEPAQVRLLVSTLPVLPRDLAGARWAAMPAARLRLAHSLRASGAQGVVLVSAGPGFGAFYGHDGALGYPLVEMMIGPMRQASDHRATDPRARAENTAPGAPPAGPLRRSPALTGAQLGLVTVDWPAGQVTLTLDPLDGDGAEPVRRTLSLADLSVGR
ncbi:hypothetical protein [Rhodothalassium salexigens]|uniref:hypothetical protein n=1 Tax=Rhodothalassium salexigens TaxID=1086 RepID=UPI001609DCD2|nr:hypothetical protein [Rhodothalassium salexigens]MBB4212744.1 alkaline phosphatase D [Rhodothalassium salexigens DSM 2132]